MEKFGKTLLCAARFLLSAVLSGAQVFGGYAPFALGAVAAAGIGWEGLAALLGAALGAALFSDFAHALRIVACSVLLFTANNAFCELRAYRKKYFLPTLTAALTLAVELVYVFRAGATEAAYCVVSALLAGAYAYCCQIALPVGARGYAQALPDGERGGFGAAPEERGKAGAAFGGEHPAAALGVLLGVLAALASAELKNGFAPGRIAAVLAVLLFAFDRDLAFSLAAALCIGLAMDLAGRGGSFLHAAAYGFGALTVGLLHRGSRVRAGGLFALSTLLFALPLEAGTGLVLLYEGLAGTLAFLLLPTRALRALHGERVDEGEAREAGLKRRLTESAVALRELYDSVRRAKPPPEENPAIVFDRAAEQVCRDCTLRSVCWEAEYSRTYNALNDATAALLRNGQGRGEDFPSYFADRCVRFSSFLAAVNAELGAFLLRRQYRSRLSGTRDQAAEQYAQLSELLSAAAERPAAARGAVAVQPLAYQVGAALRPKEGERVSGDCMSTFETDAGELCLLLSDGMGSGEAAQREASLAVRLLERFLRAGVDAPPALKTLNGALNLRAEVSDSFTTIDLLKLSLKNGEGELYKYGAAPSYVKRDRRVNRVTCSCLPAGLAEGMAPPETTRVRLESGSFFVMVTDGVADSTDDAWLQELLAGWEGENPQLLVSAILADSYEHKGASDDAGVLVLYLPRGEAGTTPQEV